MLLMLLVYKIKCLTFMPVRRKIESPNARCPAFPESFLLIIDAFWASQLIWAPCPEVGSALLDVNNSMTYISALYPLNLSLAGIHGLLLVLLSSYPV